MAPSLDPVLNVETVVVDSLTSQHRLAVTDLLSAAATVDGTQALNEQATLALTRLRPGTRHVIVRRGDGGERDVLGYAQIEDGVAQLVVHPADRRRGVGTRMLSVLHEIHHSPRAWAFGDLATARGFAAKTGFFAARTVLRLERGWDQPLPAPRPPVGAELRTFRPGYDEEAWLQVNAAAFAAHPEQGRLTRADLDQRTSEAWFDPDGFVLATTSAPGSDELGGSKDLLGFHWTKLDENGLGEVYVLGVHPSAAGRGLAKALLVAGLEHLRARGADRVQLYVEQDNTAALSLYQSYGFVTASRDVMYAQRRT